jgi:hypothetical protein
LGDALFVFGGLAFGEPVVALAEPDTFPVGLVYYIALAPGEAGGLLPNSKDKGEK